ncbi:MAG: hypothetical protein R3A47_07775 [Polyangiales bacterium]
MIGGDSAVLERRGEGGSRRDGLIGEREAIRNDAPLRRKGRLK